MKTTRSYDMTRRARAAEATRTRIRAAAFELQAERLTAEIVLEQVAQRAGVTVQTVLRHFGSRQGLFDDALRSVQAEVAREREAPPGDVDRALEVLVAHYEKRGDLALMMLAQENSYPHVRRMSQDGKQLHRTWVADTFAPQLAALAADEREQLVDLLVVATDVYTWKLLRRDRGLSRARTETRMHTLVTAVLATAVPSRGGQS